MPLFSGSALEGTLALFFMALFAFYFMGKISHRLNFKRRLIFSLVLAVIAGSHRMLIYLGDNYFVEIPPAIFYVTTFVINCAYFCLPVAAVICVYSIVRRLILLLRPLFYGRHGRRPHNSAATAAHAAAAAATTGRDKGSDAGSGSAEKVGTLHLKKLHSALGKITYVFRSSWPLKYDIAAAPIDVERASAPATASVQSNTAAAVAVAVAARGNGAMVATHNAATAVAMLPISAPHQLPSLHIPHVHLPHLPVSSNIKNNNKSNSTNKDSSKEKVHFSVTAAAAAVAAAVPLRPNVDSGSAININARLHYDDYLRPDTAAVGDFEVGTIPHHVPTKAEILMVDPDLPEWADGDDYATVRARRKHYAYERSGTIQWSSGDGENIVFTDSRGKRTVVDTTVYDRLDYRSNFRHIIAEKAETSRQQADALSLDVLSDSYMEVSSHLDEDDGELRLEREAQTIFATTHGFLLTPEQQQQRLNAKQIAQNIAQNIAQQNNCDAESCFHCEDATSGSCVVGYRLADGKMCARPAALQQAWSKVKWFFNCKLWRQVGAVCLCVSLALSLWSSFNVFSTPTSKNVLVSLDVPPAFDGLKIVQISDLYISAMYSQQRITQIVRKVTQLKPDVIVITGTIAKGKRQVMTPRLLPIFRLAAPLGVYAVVDNEFNNYFYQHFLDVYKSENFMFLTNDFTSVNVGRGRMCIAGIADKVEDSKLFDAVNYKIVQTLHDREFTSAQMSLLLANDPASAHAYQSISNDNIDLMLSDSTYSSSNFIHRILGSDLICAFSKGLHNLSDRMRLYVSAGTDVWPVLPVKVDSSGEITQIVIHSKNSGHSATESNAISFDDYSYELY